MAFYSCRITEAPKTIPRGCVDRLSLWRDCDRKVTCYNGWRS